MRRKTITKIVYTTLRRGWQSLTPDAQKLLREFVYSQHTPHGYRNAGGREDSYYRQFGKALETVFSPWKLLSYKPDFSVDESLESESIYGHFFRFLKAEGSKTECSVDSIEVPRQLTTNAVCCLLVMQYQRHRTTDTKLLAWLCERRHETGGFYASEQAPIPDMLSTAVALFTLKFLGEKVADATDFIQAHWLDTGGFMPTLMDEYSDVEYAFYGLLALGSLEDN